ncbi:MAG TPA: hypothetical protein VFA28_13535 [Bryobacteraceae bacterium]|jgi:hypothetical protein|nr:hypothetical protein [Bryobacteraceae bacterium]
MTKVAIGGLPKYDWPLMNTDERRGKTNSEGTSVVTSLIRVHPGAFAARIETEADWNPYRISSTQTV